MSFVNLGIKSYFERDLPLNKMRWACASSFIARRLSLASSFLCDRGLHFEAMAAADLAQKFDNHSLSDRTPEGFVALWEELSDLCETSIHRNGRDKTLYRLPPLPEAFGC